MCLDELVNIPIPHPLRYHCELGIIHCNPQQLQYIWMAKSVPRHNLFAEPLRESVSADQRTPSVRLETHSYDFIKVARGVNSQHLDRNMATFVFTLPHIGVPAPI